MNKILITTFVTALLIGLSQSGQTAEEKASNSSSNPEGERQAIYSDKAPEFVRHHTSDGHSERSDGHDSSKYSETVFNQQEGNCFLTTTVNIEKKFYFEDYSPIYRDYGWVYDRQVSYRDIREVKRGYSEVGFDLNITITQKKDNESGDCDVVFRKTIGLTNSFGFLQVPLFRCLLDWRLMDHHIEEDDVNGIRREKLSLRSRGGARGGVWASPLCLDTLLDEKHLNFPPSVREEIYRKMNGASSSE